MPRSDGRAPPGIPNPRGTPPRRVRPVVALVVLGVLAVSAILAATGLLVWDNYQHEVAHTEREIVTLNRSLAEQTARAIHSADLILSGARERLMRDRSAGYLMEERAVHTLLRARIDGVPHVRALSVIGPDGVIRASSKLYPVSEIHVGDQEAFRFFMDSPPDTLHVGHPLRSRVDGAWLLPVSRQIPTETGGFGGLITASIAPPYFAELYRTLDLGPGRTISLFLRDGSLVVTTAGDAESGAHADVPPFSALGAAGLQADRGLLRTEDRFIAYEAVRGYPLVAVVATTEEAALEEWRQTTARMVGGAAGVIALLGTITLLLARQLTRGEALGAALRNSEARLNGIIESARDAIVSIDERQRIVVFNRAAEKMFRCTAREALGAPLDRFIPERMRASHRERLAGALTLDSRVMGHTLEVLGVRADGEEFPAEVSVSRLQMGDNGLVTAFVRDVTKRKQAEEALRKFSRAIDQTASTVVITDPQGVIEYVNPRFVATTGYTAAEAIGQRPSMLKSGDTRPEQHEALWRTITAGGVWQGEFHNRRKDGSLYWESAIVSPIRDQDGAITHYVAIKDDITERKQAADALRESHQQLREMAATLNTLREEEMVRIARELHDELGQKLTGLKMDLSWLEGRLERDRTALHDKLAAMKALIDATVRSVRRISTGLRPLVLDDLGPIAALEWLADDFAKYSGIRIELDLGMDELDVDDRTATAIFRIVQESLTNVARHAQATCVAVSLHLEDGQLVLAIADDGKGMPPEAAGKAGGFGLVGIRERAFMCGGEFRVSSRPGEGTAIIVTIPLRNEEETLNP